MAEGDDSPEAKVIGIFKAAQVTGPGDPVVEAFHQHEHAEFHVRSLTSMVNALAPILAKVIEEGVTAGVFTSPSPIDDATFLLCGVFMCTDQGFFPLPAPDYERRLDSVIGAMGRVLGVRLAPTHEADADHPSPTNTGG